MTDLSLNLAHPAPPTLLLGEPAQLSASELWLITLGAPLAVQRGDRLNQLHTGQSDEIISKAMAEYWDVGSRSDFTTTASWLIEAGQRSHYFSIWRAMCQVEERRHKPAGILHFFGAAHAEAKETGNAARALATRLGLDSDELFLQLRNSGDWIGDILERQTLHAKRVKGFAAWDAVRLITLCRWAVQLGLIAPEEFAGFASGLNHEVRICYNNWRDFSSAYVVAGLVDNYSADRSHTLRHIHKLLNKELSSPFQSIHFQTIL